MSFLDITDLITKMNNPDQQILTVKNISGTSGRLSSSWLSAGEPGPGVAPTTSVSCTSATTGAIPFVNAGTGKLLITRVIGTPSSNATFAGTVMLYDRLNHSGGLSGTSTSAQTTNLPTAALTRYTEGDGVMAAIEIYTAVGGTATTLTASYTNQDGTAGRTSQSINFGSTGNDNAQALRFFPLPLQSGDSGVKSVESVTLAASTGTVGNFGVVLYKPLHYLEVPYKFSDQDSFFTGMLFEEIKDNACLSFISMYTNGSARIPAFSISLAET